MKKSAVSQKWFEKILKESSIPIFEYSLYKNVEEIRRADYNGKKVVLNSFDNEEMSKELAKEFINELKQLFAINFHPNIIQFHGITRDPTTSKLMLVLQFANGGSLRQHLLKKWQDDTFKISFNEIFQIARQGLDFISKRETNLFIKNQDKKLMPTLDIMTNEQSRIYKNMHRDDLTIMLLNTVLEQKYYEPSGDQKLKSTDEQKLQ
ncbi:15534_t:CDS:2, partial [Dentiscutata erythropus]